MSPAQILGITFFGVSAIVAIVVYFFLNEREKRFKVLDRLQSAIDLYEHSQRTNEVLHNHIRDSRRRLYEEHETNSTKVLNDLYLLALGKCYDKDLRRAVLQWKTRHGVLNNIGEE
jgi:hypothetical protein